MAATRSAWGAWAAWLALAAWMVARAGASGASIARLGLTGGGLTFLVIDLSWLWLAVALLLFRRWPPSPRSASLGVLALATWLAAQCFTQAALRYYLGEARAWDLANYVQPLWRAAHGLSMTSATYDDRPVWGDHGAVAMLAFAPFTRLADDAATGMFVAQALVTGGAVIAAHRVGRALGLPEEVSLAGACVLASSRALVSAARFDFHPECAFVVLLLALAAAQLRGRNALGLGLTLASALLRDVAAMTVAMFWLATLVRPAPKTPRRIAAMGFLLAAGIACVDVVLIPRLTGWTSYVAMHGSTPVDLTLAVKTTLLRGLSTFGIGWLHPATWVVGAPWIAAAAVSPKLIVKGIDFQYGFLFVPVALLGALYALAWLHARRPGALGRVAAAWAALAVSVNAPLPEAVTRLPVAAREHQAVRASLAAELPGGAAVVADACAAPYVMERASLRVLCRLDTERLRTRGEERWEAPVSIPPEATHLVVRPGCAASGPCAVAQVRHARHVLGFERPRQAGPYVVLRRAVRAVRAVPEAVGAVQP
ncbi:MAG: DUF2079 domain-containing protein [Polyangiales bacterium]